MISISKKKIIEKIVNFETSQFDKKRTFKLFPIEEDPYYFLFIIWGSNSDIIAVSSAKKMTKM